MEINVTNIISWASYINRKQWNFVRKTYIQLGKANVIHRKKLIETKNNLRLINKLGSILLANQVWK